MSKKGNKKPKLNNKRLIAIASVVTATAALLNVLFDFITKLLNVGN